MYDKKRIVRIEDSDGDVFLIKKTLAALPCPFEIICFRDGAEARPVLLAAQAAEIPDLILLDLTMPHSHGLDILRQIG